MDAMEPQWTHEEGLRYEVAKEVLSGEIGLRNVALRALGTDNEADRVRLRDERTAIMHLKQTLDIHDDRRISAILERNLDEALIDEAPMMRAG